jgi:hypothetical protein
MLELADRVFEIVVRDSRIECVDIFRDFQKFQNLRRLTIVRSNVRRLNEDCDVKSDASNDVKDESENDASSDRAELESSSTSYLPNFLLSLEVLDVSDNLLTRLIIYSFNVIDL